MNSKRLYGLLIFLLVMAGGGLAFSVQQADGLLQKHSRELVGLKAKHQALANQEKQLAKDKADVAKYAELNTIAKSVVPQDKDQAEAVREIVSLAKKSGIPELSSITFPASNLGGTSKATKKQSTNLTQVTPVKGISGVYDLQITVTVDPDTPVPYSSFISFLGRLEQNRRTAQVSSINVQPDPKVPGVVSFTLVIDEYIKP